MVAFVNRNVGRFVAAALQKILKRSHLAFFQKVVGALG